MNDKSPYVLPFCILLLLTGAAGFYLNRTPAVVPPPPAPAHRYALEGTFFLLEYVSVRTPKGIYGFEPGHQVQFVEWRKDGQTMLVTDRKQSVEVSPVQLTNDLDVAALARRNDEASQAAIVAYQERRQKEYISSHRDVFIADAENAHAAELDHNRGAAIYVGTSALNEPARPVGYYNNFYNWRYGNNPLNQPAQPASGYYDYGYPYASYR